MADNIPPSVQTAAVRLREKFFDHAAVLDSAVHPNILDAVNAVFRGGENDRLLRPLLPMNPKTTLPYLDGVPIPLTEFIRGVRAALKDVCPVSLQRLLDRAHTLHGGVNFILELCPSQRDCRWMQVDLYKQISTLYEFLRNLKVVTPHALDFALVAAELLGKAAGAPLQSTDLDALAVACYRLCRLHGLLIPHNRQLYRAHIASVGSTTPTDETPWSASCRLTRSLENPFIGDEATHLQSGISRLISVLSNCGGLPRSWTPRKWGNTHEELHTIMEILLNFLRGVEHYANTNTVLEGHVPAAAGAGAAGAGGGGEVEG